jgi:heme exporter protein C
VLLLIYVGYLSLRKVADSPARRARWSAVLGVIGFVDVPIVHMSVVWWRSLHQQATVLRPGAPTIAGSMLATLLLAFVAFSLAYGYLMAVRMRLGRLEDRTDQPVSLMSTPRARRPVASTHNA